MDVGAMNLGSTAAYAAAGASKSSSTYGKTIGDAKLSEKAEKYYEELKSKFSNMDFVLVSAAEKNNAEAKAAQFASSGKTLVLIDDEKIEKMANDEEYRKKYEGIISNAASSLDSMKSTLAGMGLSEDDIKNYGVRVGDDGTASFFVALKKSSDAQMARIEKKREENKTHKKEAEKAKAKEAAADRMEKRRDAKVKEDEGETITASSIDELVSKLQGYVQNDKLSSVRTEAEMSLGQHIDFRG